MQVPSTAPQKPAASGTPAASTAKSQQPPASAAASFAQALDDVAAELPVEPPANAAQAQTQALAAKKLRDAAARNETPARPPKSEATAKAPGTQDKAEDTAAARRGVPHDKDEDAAAPDLAGLLPGWQPPAAETIPADAAKAAGARHAGSDALRAGAKGAKDAGEAEATLLAADADAKAPKSGAGADFGATLAAAAQAAEPRAAAGREGADAATSSARPAGDAAMQPLAAPLSASSLPAFAPAAADAASTPFQAHLAAAVTTPDFAPALGAQVSILAKDGIQEARLHLNPAEMGPIAIQIELTGAHARVEFTAEHAATRAAIEQGLPDLAAALQEAGLTLAGGGVFEQKQQQQGQARDGQRGSPAARLGGSAEVADVQRAAAARPVTVRNGGVDVFA